MMKKAYFILSLFLIFSMGHLTSSAENTKRDEIYLMKSVKGIQIQNLWAPTSKDMQGNFIQQLVQKLKSNQHLKTSQVDLTIDLYVNDIFDHENILAQLKLKKNTHPKFADVKLFLHNINTYTKSQSQKNQNKISYH